MTSRYRQGISRFSSCRLLLFFLFALLCLPIPAWAEIRTLSASGEYRMGDRDTREEAVRLAMEAAKRNALEQVGTYLESVTTVTDLQVTADEIRTYTAGLVSVLEQQTRTRLEGETLVVQVALKAQVDPDEVAQAIAALRQNQDAQRELVALRVEVEQLHKALEETNRSLASATAPEQVQTLSQQRQQLLNQVQADTLVAQAWTDWVFVASPVNEYPLQGVTQVQGLLVQAGRLNPANPHVASFQQILARQGFSQPAQPGLPSVQPIPSHPAVPLPPSLHQVRPPHMARAYPYVPRASLRSRSSGSSGRHGSGYGSRGQGSR